MKFTIVVDTDIPGEYVAYIAGCGVATTEETFSTAMANLGELAVDTYELLRENESRLAPHLLKELVALRSLFHNDREVET